MHERAILQVFKNVAKGRVGGEYTRAQDSEGEQQKSLTPRWGPLLYEGANFPSDGRIKIKVPRYPAGHLSFMKG